jgi:hypothetical protein
MQVATSTFAGQLKHFAQSVDLVDSHTFDQVRELVCTYVMKELHGEYFELLRAEDTTDESERALRTFWSSEKIRHQWRIHTEDGSNPNPITTVFGTNKPLWLVDDDKKPLNAEAQQKDLWSGVTGLAEYHPTWEEPIRTAILVPLAFRRVLGVYCIESRKYIEPTDVAKLELRTLASALAILYASWDYAQAQSFCKGKAISDLHHLLTRARFPKLAKPHTFLAFSSRADESVEHLIKDVLSEFKDKLEWTNWDEMYQSGNISQQIAKEVMESRFGICYMSEPVEDGSASTAFIDNVNVVFEAGMLHARTTASAEENGSGDPSGWIPIREDDSPPAPFDFAAERILIVPRSKNGELNESRFRELLGNRIHALLGEEQG